MSIHRDCHARHHHRDSPDPPVQLLRRHGGGRYDRCLIGSALAVAIIGLIQGVGVSSSIPNRDGEYPDASRDFAGQGLSNIVAGLFLGVPLGGSVSQTAVVLAAGAKTRITPILTGLFVAALIVVFGAQLKIIPLPTIAALLVFIGAEIIQGQQIREVWRTSLSSRTVLTLTFGATLVLQIQIAGLSGVTALSFFISTKHH